MAELRVESITRRFGSTVAVDDVTLRVEDGEVLALLGPSGCGKSTLLRVVAGLETPDAGRVLLDGRDVTLSSPGDRDVAMVFQSYALYPHMTVEENVAVHLRLRKVPKDEVRRRVGETAELLGIRHLLGRRPRQLSGGQRQRVALARAIIRQPRLFLLDEPLSNLDALLRERTRRELKLLFARLGTTVVYVTHDQSEAMTLADRIAVLREGRLEQVGSPEEIYARPASRFVAGFVGSPPMNLLEVEVRDGRLVLPTGETLGGLPGGAIGAEGSAETPRGAVLLGVRPEDVGVEAGEEAGGGLHLPGRLVLVESLGSHSVLTLAVGQGGGDSLPRIQAVVGHGEAGEDAARGSAAALESLRAGTPVTVRLAPSRLHLFDSATGRRLPG